MKGLEQLIDLLQKEILQQFYELLDNPHDHKWGTLIIPKVGNDRRIMQRGSWSAVHDSATGGCRRLMFLTAVKVYVPTVGVAAVTHGEDHKNGRG
jgi:hypothetical protein